jgi:hypothetical protein
MSFYFKKNWIYIDWKHYIYIDISNPKKTMNKLKGIFKPLKLYFRFTKDIYAPYPVLWVSEPSYIQIMFHDVGWKDKYDTPRFEYHPYVWIHVYKWNFLWYWDFSKSFKLANSKEYIDEYWEQALWYLYYYNTYSQGLLDKPNIEKAKENWPWKDWETKKSSWNNKFLIK